MEALGIQDPEGDTSSDAEGISPPFPGFGSPTESFSDGETIDAEIVDEGESVLPPADSSAVKGRRDRNKRATPGAASQREAKSGPPSLDEWSGFFSKVVLRITTEWYISYAFRGIDEDNLSDREIERLAMTDEERAMIATPFAELSNKSKFMRRHGRMIVASGDAFNALVVLGAWASRVNRIAMRHKPKVVRGNVNGSSGQSTAEANGTAAAGSYGGRLPDGFYGPIFPGSG